MPKTETKEQPTWAQIHGTAKTFLEGLGDDGVHDLVSLARIEKNHAAGMIRTTKATAMVKNICSFFDNNPFKGRNGIQFSSEMQTRISNIGVLTSELADLIDASEHKADLFSLYLPRQTEARIKAGNTEYTTGAEIVQVILGTVNRNAVSQHKAAAKGDN